MGVRFRKSINLGKGFRINMSKTGPGFSWGGKGFRITKTAKGNIRGTAYIPGTGLSYQKEFKNPLAGGNKLGKKEAKKKVDDSSYSDAQSYGLDFKKLESTGLEDILQASESKKPYMYIGIGLALLGIALFFVNPLFLALSVLGLILCFYKKGGEDVSIDYDFEGDSKEEYDLTNKLLAGILESDEVFLVNELAEENERNIIVDRSNLTIGKNLPKGFETNVEVINLKSDDFSIYFLPDALMLEKNGKVKAIDYKDLKIDLRAEDFMEEGKVAKDATLIEKTYKHANKDGGPDKRYKDNPEVNIVEYGILEMKGSNINLMIVFSDTVIDGK